MPIPSDRPVQLDTDQDWYDAAADVGRNAYQNSDEELDDNPFDPAFDPHAHRGWRDGWIAARERAYGR